MFLIKLSSLPIEVCGTEKLGPLLLDLLHNLKFRSQHNISTGLILFLCELITIFEKNVGAISEGEI